MQTVALNQQEAEYYITSKIDAATYNKQNRCYNIQLAIYDATTYNKQDRCYIIQLARKMLQHSTSKIDATTFN